MSLSIASLNQALEGRYHIERELGQGGMATVFLADDLKHDRKVAVKVLKPELAAVLGAERFVVEIKTTASLQHPHILPLFDSGTADGFLFYVMPFIEGETLRDKLNRESQFGVEEAVRIAREIADALDYAHRHGVIHRDIKPENILLHDGRPMVADFGIALALSAAAGGRMTETGLSLGTPHYMSPEQATADKDITARADVYSLASVLYEMLAGEPPHTGSTAQQIIMKIIAEPVQSVTRLRKAVPPNVAAALSKALEKLPADRFETAKAFADALANPSFTLEGTSVFTAASARKNSRALVAFGTGCIGFAALAVWALLRAAPAPPVLRYTFTMPSIVGTVQLGVPVIAPDGSYFVFLGPVQGGGPGQQVWMKRRDAYAATPVPGTVGAEAVTISPDGKSLALAGTQLRTLVLASGVTATLVDRGVASAGGTAWLDDGTIVYVRSEGGLPELASVSSAGGQPTLFHDSENRAGVFPAPIVGRRAILFARCVNVGSCDLAARDLSSGLVKTLVPGAVWGQYAVTGHVVYVLNGRLMASVFDAKAMELRGQPVSLVDSVANAPISLSRSGTLVLQIGSAAGALGEFELVWVERNGHYTPIDTTWHFRLTANANDHGWALSRDGKRLAIGLFTPSGDDIYVKELPRGPASRVTYAQTPDQRPRWSPDERSIMYVGTGALLSRAADGTGKDSVLVSGAVEEGEWSPDGKWIVLRRGATGSARGGRNIFGVRAGSDTTSVPLIVTEFDEEAIQLSPDGKWIAYQSDETGHTEIFVRPFPNTNASKRQVSSGGGEAPLWSRDGREVFFVRPNHDMMSARVSTALATSITSAEPAVLFHVPDELLQVEYSFYTPWDVAADGRFIMVRSLRSAATGTSSAVTVIAENWLQELKARVK
jgi:serine/threonine-protein kinase